MLQKARYGQSLRMVIDAVMYLVQITVGIASLFVGMILTASLLLLPIGVPLMVIGLGLLLSHEHPLTTLDD